MPSGKLEVAKTLRSQPPQLSAVEAQLLLAGGRMTKGIAKPVPKVALLPAPTSFLFKT
jgi:hypothetical protein